MIVRTVKPEFAARCDVCHCTHTIKAEADEKGSPSLEMRQEVTKLGFTLVNVHFQTPTNSERGQHDLYLCPVCVRALITAITHSDKAAVPMWETVSASFPEGTKELWRQPSIKDAATPIEDIKPVTIEMKGAVVNVVESTVGLPANTCSLLQNKAEQFSIAVTDEMSAALKRLYGQKGTVEDIGLWREVAVKAGVNLPDEANLRPFESVAEEIRKNA